ncbi:GNAT family N-acetyltransferase [Cohnella silvisoli]|uniref:GNAT family N-acetyltransferase n=1 Tax=Cohnella silvisoli TaxID=2873699 RepID=A0ABV1KNN7_9BACL|nr:GNAT family N-acetyltransferase [Cohnella silvisoli]MCD9021033.1 GNAT family N-acetyltransferase [Cohnella silvisoli]
MNVDGPLSKLIMKKETLFDLPAFHCPTGYRIRHFEPGDERNWEDLIRLSYTREVDFGQKIGTYSLLFPDRILFLCRGEQPVATATAWQTDKADDSGWYLHMVGVLPEYSGKGLGFAITIAALHKMREVGCELAFLETDDFRLPAIRIYLKLGFQPVYKDESHPARWERIVQLISQR